MFIQPAYDRWKRSPEHTNFTTVCCYLQNGKGCMLGRPPAHRDKILQDPKQTPERLHFLTKVEVSVNHLCSLYGPLS